MKTRPKPPTPKEAKRSGNALEIQWEKYDLKQFRTRLNAELAAGTKNAVTTLSSSDPKLLDKVVRAHLQDASDPTAHRLVTEKSRREHDSKRAITQAEATASFKG